MQKIDQLIPDSATQQVLCPTFAQKTASIALSSAMQEERDDRKIALLGGIDGMSEYLNERAERRANAQSREDNGFTVSPDQRPYWYGLSGWFHGRFVGLDGMPIGAQSAMDWRVDKDTEKLMTTNARRLPKRIEQFQAKKDLMQSAVARIDSAGESVEVPRGWLTLAVGWAEERDDFLEGATFKSDEDLEADRFLIKAWIATT